MALQYVGGKSVTGNSGTLTLTLNSGLTGGIGSAVQAGDLVIVSYSAVSTANLSITLGDGTWDSPTGLWANDTRDANMRVASKIMGGTPDTQVQGSGNTTATNGATMTCQVWRGADPITPQDVAMQTATAINSAVPNPPSVTPVTAGAVVVAIGCGSGAATNPTVTAPTGYSNLVQATVDPGNSITSAMASKAWSGSGAEDPGTFGGITTSTSDGWCAATFVIRPLILSAPTVTTQAASSIGTTTATGNGNITATGNENADARGIVYSTSSHGAPGNVAPASSGYESVNNETGSFGTGAFTRSLTGLTSNQIYYARAYAHNSSGYSYGAEISFTTVATFNDRRQAIIDHIVSAQSETNGWNAKRSSIPVTAVVRTSATVVTITLPAIASYDITAAEHLTVTVPGEALTGGNDIVGDQTVDIAATAAGFTLTAQSGSVGIGGTNAGANIGRNVTAQPGSVGISGTNAGTNIGRNVTAQPGSVGIAGTSASLTKGTTATIWSSPGTNVTVSGATVTKTGGGADAYDAYTTSVDSLTGDGYFEFSVPGLQTAAIGLTSVATPSIYLDFEIALSFGTNGVVEFRGNAWAYLGETSYAANDVFRITRSGTTITVTQNGSPISASWPSVSGAKKVFVLLNTASSAFTETALSGFGAASTAYTLTASAGAVSVTGTNAGVNRGSTLSASAGAVTVVGTDAGLLKNALVGASSGIVDVTGTNTGLLKSALVSASPGALAVTGIPAGTNRGYSLTATLGVVSLTGTQAGLNKGFVLAATVGSVPFTGTSAGLIFARGVTATAGAVPFTGSNADLYKSGNFLNASPGAISVTGTDATLRETFVVVASPGAVSITGTAAGVNRGFPLTANIGTVSVTGTAANLNTGCYLSAQSGLTNIVGTDVSLRQGKTLTVSSGVVSIIGTDAVLTAVTPNNFNLTATAGVIAVTGTAVDFRSGRSMTAQSGAMAVTGVNALMWKAAILLATGAAMPIIGTDAILIGVNPGSHSTDLIYISLGQLRHHIGA